MNFKLKWFPSDDMIFEWILNNKIKLIMKIILIRISIENKFLVIRGKCVFFPCLRINYQEWLTSDNEFYVILWYRYSNNMKWYNDSYHWFEVIVNFRWNKGYQKWKRILINKIKFKWIPSSWYWQST